MGRWILSATFIAGLAGAAEAATRTVPSDDFPTLQSAIDASGTGDTIVLLAGTYTDSVDIVGKTDLRILGKGNPVIDPASNAIDVDSCPGLEISGITIQGANNGLFVFDTQGIKVNKVVFRDIAFEALSFSSSSDIVVTRCSFTDVGGKGIENAGSPDLAIDRCVFNDCAEGAIVLAPTAVAGSASEGARITRCTITGPSPGLRAGGAGLVIDRNRFTVDGGYALDLETTAKGDGAMITRNVFAMTGTDRAAGLSGVGILFQKNRITGGGVIEQGADNTLDRNTVANADFGIAVNGSACTILGNRLSDLAGHGLDMTNGGHRVEKNRIERCVNSGIYASVTNSTFTANRITDAEYGILVVYGGNSFSKNRVAGTTVLDLWDQQNVGANTYGTNAFRTSLFGPGS